MVNGCLSMNWRSEVGIPPQGESPPSSRSILAGKCKLKKVLGELADLELDIGDRHGDGISRRFWAVERGLSASSYQFAAKQSQSVNTFLLHFTW